VVRPHRVVRFAHLIHRPGAFLGGPSIRAASGTDLMPTALLPSVVRHD